MNEDHIKLERARIERRVAGFRETQARFQRAREDYYEATIERVRAQAGNGFEGEALVPRMSEDVR